MSNAVFHCISRSDNVYQIKSNHTINANYVVEEVRYNQIYFLPHQNVISLIIDWLYEIKVYVSKEVIKHLQNDIQTARHVEILPWLVGWWVYSFVCF